jgi:hypothetical protein
MSVRSAWSGSWPTLDARIRLTSPTQGRCRIRTTLSHLLDDALYGSGQYLVSRGEWAFVYGLNALYYPQGCARFKLCFNRLTA